jgi:hypothetical protein
VDTVVGGIFQNIVMKPTHTAEAKEGCNALMTFSSASISLRTFKDEYFLAMENYKHSPSRHSLQVTNYNMPLKMI